MKSKEIKKTINIVKKAYKYNDSKIPILNCIKFEKGDYNNFLRYCGSNIEITKTIDDDSFNKDFVIDIKEFDNALKIFEGDIELQANENITIKGNNRNYKLKNNFDPVDYPILYVFKDRDSSQKLDTKIFKDTLEILKDFTSQDETRYILQGIYFHDNKAVATDAHKISVYKIPGFNTEIDYTLPNSAIDTLREVIKEGYELKEINTYANGLKIEYIFNQGLTIRVRTIDGRFPDYDRVIPGKPANDIIINKDNILKAIKTAKKIKFDTIIFNEGKKDIKFKKTDDKEKEFNMENVLKNTFKNEIGLNLEYLKTILDKLESEDLKIEYDYSTDPIKIIESNKTFVLMPIRL
jgi:DNA polymerase-3 subunit beta